MIELNLLPDDLKPKAFSSNKNKFDPKQAVYFLPLALGLIILAHIFLLGFNIARSCQLNTLNNKWAKLSSERKAVDEFRQKFAVSSQDAKIIQQLSSQSLGLSQLLKSLSANVPSGVWFNEIAITAKDFSLNGSCISLQKQEMALVNKLIGNLKNDPGFFQGFVSLDLNTLQRRVIGGYEVVDFSLSGALKVK